MVLTKRLLAATQIWITLLLCLRWTVIANFVDYTENTELIQQRAGYDVRLQCNLKGLVDERKRDEIKIRWHFKQCNDNNCYHSADANDWTALPCEQSLCRSELWLRNVTERYSGLYKCTINPRLLDFDEPVDIQLVRTYQLDVTNSSLVAPEFLDAYPANKTAIAQSQVVFQCRVHSEEHPTIKWFRRLSYSSSSSVAEAQPLLPSAASGSNFNAHIVRYNGRTYELLHTASEKLIESQVYLSKLILNGVRTQDEGFYACVAISFRGHKIREAYLQVLPDQTEEEEAEYWSDYDDSDEGGSDPREFWLLFLMPLGLALLPITVWGIYLLHRYFRDPNDCERIETNYSDEDLDTERCVLGGS